MTCNVFVEFWTSHVFRIVIPSGVRRSFLQDPATRRREKLGPKRDQHGTNIIQGEGVEDLKDRSFGRKEGRRKELHARPEGTADGSQFSPPCKEREQRLLKTAWKCSCRCNRDHPLHAEKCMLFPNRCRGCNLQVRHEDIRFPSKRASNRPWFH